VRSQSRGPPVIEISSGMAIPRHPGETYQVEAASSPRALGDCFGAGIGPRAGLLHLRCLTCRSGALAAISRAMGPCAIGPGTGLLQLLFSCGGGALAAIAWCRCRIVNRPGGASFNLRFLTCRSGALAAISRAGAVCDRPEGGPATTAFFVWGRRPRRDSLVPVPDRESARGRASYNLRFLTCRSAPSPRLAGGRVRSARGRPLTTAFFVWGRRPRRDSSVPVPDRESARGRASYNCFFVWGRRPRRD